MERKKFKKRFKMNTRSILSFIMLFALCLSAVWNISWADCRAQEKIMDESHKSIKVTVAKKTGCAPLMPSLFFQPVFKYLISTVLHLRLLL